MYFSRHFKDLCSVCTDAHSECSQGSLSSCSNSVTGRDFPLRGPLLGTVQSLQDTKIHGLKPLTVLDNLCPAVHVQSSQVSLTHSTMWPTCKQLLPAVWREWWEKRVHTTLSSSYCDSNWPGMTQYVAQAGPKLMVILLFQPSIPCAGIRGWAAQTAWN